MPMKPPLSIKKQDSKVFEKQNVELQSAETSSNTMKNSLS